MADPIPASVRDLWDSWSIRVFIILSLSIQIFLFLFSSLRKKTGNMAVYFLIWAAYLLADWVPTFTAGLILNSVSASNNSSVPSTRPGVGDDLLALWAASLLWHLGGSFSITAFALEDNELWFRHSIILVIQFATALYVFLCTLPSNKLLVPTIFALLGGLSSYAQRVRSMHHASLDRYREDIVREPYTLDDVVIKDRLQSLQEKNPGEPLRRPDMSMVACHCFEIFKGLVVNIQCMSHEQEKMKDVFCNNVSSEDAYQLILCELKYMYGVFYTNHLAFRSSFGVFCWEVSMVSSIVVLTLFVRAGKQDFHHVDIRISNAMVIVSLVLHLMVSYRETFSESSWLLSRAYPCTKRNNIVSTIVSISNVVSAEISHFVHKQMKSIHQIFKLKESQVKIEGDIMHKIDGSPLFFREWSESICSHNLISFSMKERPRVISWPYRPWPAQIFKILHIPFQVVQRVMLFLGKLGIIISYPVLYILGLKDILDRTMYASRDPFDKELWDFIFTNLRDVCLPSINNEAAGKSIKEARGGWALQNSNQNSNHTTKLLDNIDDFEYDERLLLWHIATELCYNAEDDGDLSCFVNAEGNGDLSDGGTNDKRVFSKMLSDYMLYLMVFQPGMMSTISGIFLRRYDLTSKKTSSFLRRIHPEGVDGKMKEACRSIFNSRAEFSQTDSRNGDGSGAILSRACTLAEELLKLPKGERWRVLSHVWLEMLMYAAKNCRGDIHARSLCRGGELLSLVWLLMAHLGLIEAFVSSGEKSSEQQEQSVDCPVRNQQ